MTDHMESAFIEIDNEQLGLRNNAIIGVIYRPPNTDILSFNDSPSEIMSLIKAKNKSCYVLGDYNINLLNTDTHSYTREFVYTMYSHSLLPNITKPTWEASATLIDNIFSNDIFAKHNTVSGILDTGITDHFPIFHVILSSSVKHDDYHLGLGLGGTGRELGAHRARVSASTDSRLLKVGSESAFASWAGRWFHSRMVLFTNECLISSVLPDRSRNLWRCDALVLESACSSPSRSGVTATSPCTILYMRARRWDFRRCSNVCHLRSLASWETLTCSWGLFPHTQRTALFCIFCNASWSFFQCGSHYSCCIFCAGSYKAEVGSLF